MVSTDSVVVRPAEGDDFDAWLRLFRAVADEARWIGTEPPVEEATARALFGSAAEGFMLVGALGGHAAQGRLSIGMFVAKEWRGRGVGSLLLAECLRRARLLRAHKVSLEVWPHNHDARRLYRRFGFLEEGHLRAHHDRRNVELWDVIVMGLVLDDRCAHRPSPASPEPATASSPVRPRHPVPVPRRSSTRSSRWEPGGVHGTS